MNLQLSQEDQRAVDLLLDRAATAKGNESDGQPGHMVYAVTDPSLGERVARIQRLLHLLDAMPTPEPPANLSIRTVEFVERVDQRQSITSELPSLLGSQRPAM